MVDLTREYDVVVLGGGNAAMSAAITARRAGASVLVVEHAPPPMRGGNSRHTRNFRAMHTVPTDVLTEAYLEEEYWNDLKIVTAGKTDEALARLTIRGSTEAFHFMRSCGAQFQPSLTGTLNLSRTNAFFLGGGKALLNAYYATAARIGIDVLYDTEVTALELVDGTVKSVSLTCHGFPETIRPRAVVAACGGFQANIEWMREYWGDAADNFVIRGTPYSKGRILRNLLDQGVAPIGDPTQFHSIALDGRAPKFDGGIVTRLDSVPFSIVVNRDGRRFYDEGEDVWPKRYAIWGRLIAQQPGQIAYSICDAKAAALFMPSVFPAIKANTITELAQKLGLDPQTVQQTITTYNNAVQPGEFSAAGKLDTCSTAGLSPAKSHWARKIDEPPYYGYPLRPGITFTYLSVKVDETARVMMSNGEPTANLYAAGEIMSGNILGQGYLAGFGMTIGCVFGRLAGAGAATHA